jgi:hypothetical protein
MDARRQLTDVVLEGFAPTLSLVDPRAIHVVALIMVEVFLGISRSRWRTRMEETLPSKVPELQESNIAVSEAPGGKGAPPHLFNNQL